MSGPVEMAPARARFPLYNTLCAVDIYAMAGGAGEAQAALAAAGETARQVQRMLDIHDPASELSRLNRTHRVGRPCPVGGELYAYLKRLDALARASGGVFDSTISPVVRLWNFTAENPRVPTDDEIGAALARTGYEAVLYDDASQSITFTKPGMELDAGASGKGYAVERVADALKHRGVTCASVNFGGNLFAIGSRPDGRPWRVGIQRPWAPRGQSMGAVALRDAGAATSGGYDRFFQAGGKTYHHLIHPRTGRPAESDYHSVTIVSASAFLTDLLSTPFFVGGAALGRRLVAQAPAPTGYVLVRKDYTLEFSPDIQANFETAE